jgi:hypothetical protein
MTERNPIAKSATKSLVSDGLTRAQRAIVVVGDGRGFVVPGDGNYNFIVTAAHCLPFVPPPHPARNPNEYIYKNLIRPLDRKRMVWAECLFVDTMADIALLGAPDNMELYKQYQGYGRVIDGIEPIAISAPPKRLRQKLPSIGDASPRYGPSEGRSGTGVVARRRVARLHGRA